MNGLGAYAVGEGNIHFYPQRREHPSCRTLLLAVPPDVRHHKVNCCLPS